MSSWIAPGAARLRAPSPGLPTPAADATTAAGPMCVSHRRVDQPRRVLRSIRVGMWARCRVDAKALYRIRVKHRILEAAGIRRSRTSGSLRRRTRVTASAARRRSAERPSHQVRVGRRIAGACFELSARRNVTDAMRRRAAAAEHAVAVAEPHCRGPW
jgi:hypothetical protein